MTFPGTTEVSGSTTAAFGDGATDFLTVRHLRAAGSNRAIGQAWAHAARQAHGPIAGPTPAANRIVQQGRRSWFAMNHPV